MTLARVVACVVARSAARDTLAFEDSAAETDSCRVRLPIALPGMPTLEEEPLTNASDRAGQAYWNRVWAGHGTGQLPDPRAMTHVERRFAAFFDSVLEDSPPSSTFLEIGCANSIWLPYFAKRGFRVTGIDYSDVGCAQTCARFEAAGVDVEIVCADAFSPPARLIEGFDVVFTLGVIEHFDDTAKAVAAISRFLRPGGILLTVVPNVRGANGIVQRVVNPRVLRMHVPLTPSALVQAHAGAGLLNVHARYFIPSNFGVINLNDLDPRARATRAKGVAVRQLCRLSRAVWQLDRVLPLPTSRAFAGYIIATARKAS
jgi:SAM-dependent methyltransferase